MTKKLVNMVNQSHSTLNECKDQGLNENIKENTPDGFTNQDDGNRGWLEDISNKKIGIGKSNLCDPMQTGQIVNDLKEPNRNTIYRYSKSLRGCSEAVMDLFKNIIVLDEDGKAHTVPLIWGTQERAVAAILQNNVRKDNSLVVDRIVLPMMAIHSNDIQFNQERYIYTKAVNYLRDYSGDGKPGFTTKEKYERDTIFGVTRGIPIDVGYTLYIWTLYLEDIDQILEQILLKFNPIAYITVRGISWETIVKLDSVANNIDTEPGDKTDRVIKYQISLTAETFISQPIVRKKAILNTKLDFYNDTKEKEINEVITRLEDNFKEE